MCGIYGIAKSPTAYTKRQRKVVKKVIREMAIDSETRGSHSSGIAQVGTETRIHKSLLPSSKFVDTKQFNQSVKSLQTGNNILLGHTRFATDGAIVKSNAHPFRVGNVVGAHNGCVYNIDEMTTKLGKQCPVDSQLIFKAINDSDNIQDAVKHFDSDFALSFVKDNPNILYLCRESNRPLYVAYVPSLKTLFYASEEGFIEDALDEVNIKTEIVSLHKNTLYAFDTTLFTDKQTNYSATKFEYDSREYNFNLNSYGWDDNEWQPIIPQQYVEDEMRHLAELYDTKPEQWYYDESEDEWMCHVDGYVVSESVMSEMWYEREEQEWAESQLQLQWEDTDEELVDTNAS